MQAYIVSEFLLVGLLSVAWRQVPLTPLTALFFTVWCGTLFYWLVQNSRAERRFASDRISIFDGQVTHSFHYTVTEAAHTRIDVASLTEVRVHSGTPIGIELIGAAESDFLFLPSSGAVERFRAALERLNPAIEFREAQRASEREYRARGQRERRTARCSPAPCRSGFTDESATC